jgi:hypothetical protein
MLKEVTSIEKMYTGVIRMLKMTMHGVITKTRKRVLTRRNRRPPEEPVGENHLPGLISSSPSKLSRP